MPFSFLRAGARGDELAGVVLDELGHPHDA
jgi:hypothetical protein